MKIHIGINIKPLNGYVTIDPCGGVDKVVCDIHNLNEVVSDNEAEEIFAQDILDYIHISRLEPTLAHYASKLRHGGKLILGGTDLFEVSSAINTGDLDDGKANLLLYGNIDLRWYIKKSCYTCSSIANMIHGLGLIINKKKINGYEYVVEAVRP